MKKTLKAKNILFITTKYKTVDVPLEFYLHVEQPLPKILQYDVPVPREIMDPNNTKPDVKQWTYTTTFYLRKDAEGNQVYIDMNLENRFKRVNK
jgi:hypothetical protein